jgi:hypothetical protein
MSEWSKQAAKRFLEQEKTKKKQEQEENDRKAALIRDQKLLSDQEILQRRAPEMWLDLYQRFESECKELNSDIGKNLLDCRKSSDENTIEIIRKDPRTKLTLVCDPQTYSITFLGLAVDDIGRLDIKIQPGTSESKFFDKKLRLISDPAQIVRHCLGELLS